MSVDKIVILPNIQNIASSGTSRNARVASAQTELQSQINVLNYELVGLIERQKAGLINEFQEADLKTKKAKLVMLKTALKRKKDNKESARNSRDIEIIIFGLLVFKW